MAATTYTLTTAAAGIDRCPQSVAVALDSSDTATITLAATGGDLSAASVAFTSEAGPKTVTVTPHLGVAGGTVSITGTNDAELTDPSPATVTLAAKPRRQRGLRGLVNDVAF